MKITKNFLYICFSPSKKKKKNFELNYKETSRKKVKSAKWAKQQQHSQMQWPFENPEKQRCSWWLLFILHFCFLFVFVCSRWHFLLLKIYSLIIEIFMFCLPENFFSDQSQKHQQEMFVLDITNILHFFRWLIFSFVFP